MYRIEITEVTEKEVGPAQSYQKLNDEGKYGWVRTPDRTEIRELTRKVLTQEVETVDVAAVIKAINNL